MVTWVKRMLILVCLEIVFISVQDKCMVSDKSTTGMENALGTPPATPRLCMSGGSLFRSVWR
jgi:hypothetical protein